MNEVTIRIPATSANLGPGYDCLGVALRLYNFVSVAKGRRRPNAMADEAASLFFKTTALKPFAFQWSIAGDVPQSRGLGSSVTVRLGLLHGLNELSGKPLNGRNLFELCARLEGHPDNAAPAAFGGFTVAGPDGNCLRFPVSPKLKFVLLVPDFEVATPAARKVLPKQISHAGAVFSCANACRITAAFASRKYQQLKGNFHDHLHQPHRAALVPFLPQVLEAAEKAGAIGGFLSGSGSTIACLVEESGWTGKKVLSVSRAMLKAAQNPGAQIIITDVDNTGVKKA